MKKNQIRRSFGDAVFDWINLALLLLVVVLMLYPLYFTVVASLSDPYATARGETYFWVKDFTLDAYRNVFINKQIWSGYANSIFYTVVGTAWALAVTIPCAYAMSRKHLKGAGILMGMFVFTMYFSGGLIPSYMLIKNLGLFNKRLALILPAGISVYNMIVARTFYRTNFPDDLYEAAKIDGCCEFGIFFKIAVPVSGAIIAVIALFVAVGHWNSYFSALLYLTDNSKWPLQLILRGILIQNQNMSMDLNALRSATMDQIEFMQKKARMAEAMKYSLIFISSAPLLVAYPFVQKYFVKGVLIGSIKG
ncbi:MAG: carbohydrate ABC transporter permease [Eubacteriales bacterium]|nr:carbohydrate ABC transporter permease [Eubacteriales bacterium]